MELFDILLGLSPQEAAERLLRVRNSQPALMRVGMDIFGAPKGTPEKIPVWSDDQADQVLTHLASVLSRQELGQVVIWGAGVTPRLFKGRYCALCPVEDHWADKDDPTWIVLENRPGSDPGLGYDTYCAVRRSRYPRLARALEG